VVFPEELKTEAFILLHKPEPMLVLDGFVMLLLFGHENLEEVVHGPFQDTDLVPVIFS
tara:strand:- start:318 stop:491 length:174 start_codon:yes stop_codon:yes gene_type:complete